MFERGVPPVPSHLSHDDSDHNNNHDRENNHDHAVPYHGHHHDRNDTMTMTMTMMKWYQVESCFPRIFESSSFGSGPNPSHHDRGNSHDGRYQFPES